MQKRVQRMPGDLQAVKSRLWAVFLSSYDDIVDEPDPLVRRAHYYAFTAIVTAYAKLHEVSELEACLKAIEESMQLEVARNGRYE
jgi:hypothetical protein